MAKDSVPREAFGRGRCAGADMAQRRHDGADTCRVLSILVAIALVQEGFFTQRFRYVGPEEPRNEQDGEPWHVRHQAEREPEQKASDVERMTHERVRTRSREVRAALEVSARPASDREPGERERQPPHHRRRRRMCGPERKRRRDEARLDAPPRRNRERALVRALRLAHRRLTGASAGGNGDLVATKGFAARMRTPTSKARAMHTRDRRSGIFVPRRTGEVYSLQFLAAPRRSAQFHARNSCRRPQHATSRRARARASNTSSRRCDTAASARHARRAPWASGARASCRRARSLCGRRSRRPAARRDGRDGK